MKTAEQRLTAEDELALAEQIRGGDQEARERMILAHLWLLELLARRYPSRTVPLEDRIQEGTLGLLRASEDFDPAVHGCRLRSMPKFGSRCSCTGLSSPTVR